MADITYVLNDPSTPDLVTLVDLPPQPGFLEFKVDGYRGATPTMYTLEHQAACAYYTLATSINYFNKFINRPVTRWATTNTLYVQPRAGRQMNAYYDRRALRFFYSPDPVTKKIVYTINSRDVVAHELGHALLDAVRPDLFNVQAMEVWGFHESFGDIHSIINMLCNESVIDFVINETCGDLHKSNVISQMAEEMGHAIYNMTGGRMGHSSAALRNAINSYSYSLPEKLPRAGKDNQLTSESHSFSRVFTGAWYDILVGIYDDLKKTMPPKEALMQARDIMARYTFQALPIAAATIRFYNSVARAMLVIDKANGYKYNQLMNDVFISRKILQMTVRPMVSMQWSMFASTELLPADEIFENPNVVAVRNKNVENLPMPYYMLNAEVANDTYYEFDDVGNCINVITTSGEELVEHAHNCIDYLYDEGMIRQDMHTPFEIDDAGNLVRTHFDCGGSTSESGCCFDNSKRPGQPEYGKGWKIENNSGCGCNQKATTPCDEPVGKTFVIERNIR